MTPSRRTSPSEPALPRYSIVRRLGEGGNGTVYRARDRLADGQEVALKVCHPQVAADEVLREFRILRELRHPAIARAFDFGYLPGGGQAYFTMELLGGSTLEEEQPSLRRRAESGDVLDLVDVIVQLVRTLAYLHSRKLLHLDLKPANVVLVDGDVRLIDFGLLQSTAALDRLRAKGTIRYAAPEVLRGDAFDERADLYSLGATLYRCCTGRHPVPGDTVEEVLENHQAPPPPPPRTLPQDLSALIMKLLARSPDDRHASAAEVERELVTRYPQVAGRATLQHFPEPRFCGRRRALDEFFRWRDEVLANESAATETPARILAVHGEAGLGKSRFVDTCLTELLGLELAVVPLPEHATRQDDGLRAMVERTAILCDASRALRAEYPFLSTSVGLSSHKASQRELAKLPLEEIRGRQFREFLQFLEKSTARPVVLIVDDLRETEAPLAHFLRRLAECGAPDTPLRAIVTYRPASVSWGESTSGVQTITLKPLRKKEIVSALDSTSPTLQAATRSRVANLSQGVPGILVQLLRHALADSDVSSLADSASLEELLHRELQDRSPAARTLFLLLALVESPISGARLRRLGDLPPTAFRQSLRSLERDGAICRQRRGIFLLRQVSEEFLIREFDAAQVREAHASLGLSLLDGGKRSAEVARHLLRGGALEQGLSVAHEALDHLAQAGRVEQAIRLSREALQHATTAEHRRAFLEALGGLLEKTGQFSESAEAYGQVLGLDGIDALQRLRVLRKLGGTHQRAGSTEQARRFLEEALELAETVTDLEEYLHLLHELAAFHLFREEYPQAMAFANRGVELLQSDGANHLDPASRSEQTLNLRSIAGHVLLRQFDYEGAATELQASLRVSEKIGSLSNTASILNNLGVAYYQGNRLDDALEVYRRAAKLARRMGNDTALFSIQCNVAAIKARRGEMQAAGDELQAIRGMPHTRRSQRARLFFLYTRGLVARLQLADAADTWAESVQLAETLPDPVLGRYSRLYAFENEIQHGRYASARTILDDIEAIETKDRSLHRAADARRAYLDAICSGDAPEVTLATASAPPEDLPPQRQEYAQVWDWVFSGAAFMEADRWAEAEAWLARSRRYFATLKQHPGTLECDLLLADLSLRRRDTEQAAERLNRARDTVALHSLGQGSRAATARLPVLEARLALQRREDDGTVLEWLREAGRQLPRAGFLELSWIVDLLCKEAGQPHAAECLQESCGRFLKGLEAADREAFLARDHRRRLGLAGPRHEGSATEDSDRVAARRFDALCVLRKTREPRKALDIVLGACASSAGAVIVERPGTPSTPPLYLARRGEMPSETLAKRILKAGNGSVGPGLCAAITSAGDTLRGAVYVELADGERAGVGDFLEMAAALMGDLLTTPRVRAVADRESTPCMIETGERTRTLSAHTLVESGSPRVQETLALVRRTRDSHLPVLLTGESGTGKDRLARWIHSLSKRCERPFLVVDCSSIPEELMEAELFGYESGAFTGAEQTKQGYLLGADGGTAYLDNIDTISLEAQARLLRVLEEREVRPVGGEAPVAVDARFIASTQRNLRELCARDEFRSDLYFRLSGISLEVPPLRERAEDIPAFIAHFQRQIPSTLVFRPRAIDLLRRHTWPGNVRELESLVRRLALTCDDVVDAPDVRGALGTAISTRAFPQWVFEGRSYKELQQDFKREHLLYLFDRFEGDIQRVARELGTTKRNVYLRLSQVGLKATELRSQG